MNILATSCCNACAFFLDVIELVITNDDALVMTDGSKGVSGVCTPRSNSTYTGSLIITSVVVNFVDCKSLIINCF